VRFSRTEAAEVGPLGPDVMHRGPHPEPAVSAPSSDGLSAASL